MKHRMPQAHTSSTRLTTPQARGRHPLGRVAISQLLKESIGVPSAVNRSLKSFRKIMLGGELISVGMPPMAVAKLE